MIWSKTFFVAYTQHDKITEYKKILAENVFSCMEFSKQSYIDIMQMPILKFYNYLKWKSSLEEEKAKIMKEESGS